LVPALGGASAPPSLPSATPAQLIADMAQARVPSLWGTLTWTADLGLSDLSTVESELGQGGAGSSSGSSGGPNGEGPESQESATGTDLLNFLSGSYQFDLWLGGAAAEHIAFSPSDDQEVDLVRNGNELWLWDSTGSKVTHVVFEGRAAASEGTTAQPAPPELTPQQFASRLLAHLGPTTSVTAGTPLYVAGQPAYQLLFAPKSSPGTTVDYIEVDVGSGGSLLGVPLRVAVYATGQSAPAIELGFTGTLNIGQPPASELTFSPPPGSQVVTHQFSGDPKSRLRDLSAHRLLGAGNGLRAEGTGWGSFVTGTDQGLVNALQNPAFLGLTSAVQVSGQPARLLGTSLLNVLVLQNGSFYAGFVTPSVLESAASSGPNA